MKKNITEALVKKLQRVAVQTQITTRTATFPSRKTPMKRLTQLKIEEEQWIEYVKRSTATAIERMKAAKIQCWIETQKNEMVFGSENRIASR